VKEHCPDAISALLSIRATGRVDRDLRSIEDLLSGGYKTATTNYLSPPRFPNSILSSQTSILPGGQFTAYC
jgi:hypothetical protein